MTSAVPLPALTATGFSSPAEADVLAGVQADFNAAFGGNLSANLETPQGQLASSETALIGAANDLFALVVNQVDPAYSSGRMQDAVGRIYFIERIPAQATTVQALCVGASGVLIPSGSLAQAADGNLYACVAGGTIPASGSIMLPFACLITGDIGCPAGTLNMIYRQVPGWDTITNPADGAIGRDVESRAAFEARRSASVALNAIGVFPSIRAAVLAVDGVTDAYVTENSTSSPASTGGVTIPAHSLYVAAVGGTDADVATAIWRKKNPGCGYTGNTAVTVQDTNSGYTAPYPSYAVTFTRPTALPIAFVVTLANSAAVSSNAVALIQNAIIAAFQGEDGGDRASIGSTVYALRFVSAIATLGAWARIISITVNGGADVTADIDQIPTVSASGISVVLA